MNPSNLLYGIIFGVVLLTGIMLIYDVNSDNYQTQWKAAAEEMALDSPKKQTELGVMAKDVMCKKEHVLAIRTNGAPMCTTINTAEILIERGVIDKIIGPTIMHENTDEVELTESQNEHVAENEKNSTAKIDRQNNQTDAGNTTTSSITNNTVINSSTTVATNTTINTSNITNININITNTTTTTNSTNSNITNNNATNATNNNTTTTTANATNNNNNHTTTTTPLAPKYTPHSGSVSTVPASTMSIVNFYITDDDLNISPHAAETILTNGLLQFTINGIPIEGPKTMIETGPNTGQFYVKLELPATINDRPLNQNDIVDITYFDQTDRAGEQQVIEKSFTLSSTYAHIQSEGNGGKRIGHEFTLTIYEPDANMDSKEEDRIPLSRFEFKSEGNIRATLDHRAFDANKSHMIETGPNTGIFDVIIKIPRQIDDKIINIGDWYEIIYNDYSTPSGTSEEIVLRGKIGLQ